MYENPLEGTTSAAQIADWYDMHEKLPLNFDNQMIYN